MDKSSGEGEHFPLFSTPSAVFLRVEGRPGSRRGAALFQFLPSQHRTARAAAEAAAAPAFQNAWLLKCIEDTEREER